MRQRDFRELPFWQLFFTLSFVTLILPLGVRQWIALSDTLPSDELRILKLVHEQVVKDYVEDRAPNELLLDAVSGMVSNLDRHSVFVPPDDVREFENTEIDGAYEGIGVLLVPDHSPATVQWPMPGGPAERAGILVGDQILAVNGEDIRGVAPEQATKAATDLILGPARSSVNLTIGRDGEELPMRIERGQVAKRKVKWAHFVDPEAGIGYVQIAGFQRDMIREFDEAIDKLRATRELRALIVDLRYNPGGLLMESIELSNRFLASGEIVSLKRRDSEVIESHGASADKCTLPDLALVILINGRSASASEVFTGAMQDHHRARVVGRRSFGKGVVQSIYQWSDLDFRLKLTTSHYYTPNGRSIEGQMRRNGDQEAEGGLEPDLEVVLDRDQSRAVQTSLFGYEPPEAYIDQVKTLAADIGYEVRRPVTPAEDPQLRTAVDEARSAIAAQATGGDGR